MGINTPTTNRRLEPIDANEENECGASGPNLHRQHPHLSLTPRFSGVKIKG
jgi:hypothetical protein